MTQGSSSMLKINSGMDMVSSRLSKLVWFWRWKGTIGRESFLMVVGCITSFCVKLAVKQRKPLRLSFSFIDVNTIRCSEYWPTNSPLLPKIISQWVYIYTYIYMRAKDKIFLQRNINFFNRSANLAAEMYQKFVQKQL